MAPKTARSVTARGGVPALPAVVLDGAVRGTAWHAERRRSVSQIVAHRHRSTRWPTVALPADPRRASGSITREGKQ